MFPQLFIETDRLLLVAATAELAETAYTDKVTFSKLLNAEVPSNWPHELLKDAEPFFADKLKRNPSSAGFWLWYALQKVSAQSSILIGGMGFKGPPLGNGVIELGYALLDEFQGLGYATEGVSALIEWAFQKPEVVLITAETFPHLHPSIRVMQKCKMTFIGAGSEEGTIRYAKSRDVQ